MSSRDRIGADELLEHSEVLRRIARGLVGDVQADDVVQEAYVTALERPPQAGSLRSWLAQVVRNLSLNALRGQGRRSAREERASRPEAVPSHEAMLERIELSRRLAECLRGLPEVYRSVVYLRFYEGRGVGEIASDLGLPRETVKTRLRRGLEKLRGELDLGTDGGRQAWMAALLPLASAPPFVVGPLDPFASASSELARAAQAANTSSVATATGSTGVLAGVVVMKKLVFALGLGVLGLGLLYSFGVFDPDRPIRGDQSARAKADLVVPEAQGEPAQPAADQDLASNRRSVEQPRATPQDTSTLAATVATGALTVEVFWESDGAPAANVEVLAYPQGLLQDNPDVRRGATDEEGRVSFTELPPGEVKLFAFRGGWARGLVEVGETASAELVIPRGLDVEGVVVAEDGSPVPGAEVWIRQTGRGWLVGRKAATADATGRFALRSVQLDRMIGARAEGFGPAIVEKLETRRVQPGEAVQLELVLRGEGGRIEGLVLDPEGEPIPGAQVVVGDAGRHEQLPDGAYGFLSPPPSLVTDADGRFVAGAQGVGTQVVFVRAEDHPITIQGVEVEAQGTVSMVVQLQRQVVVEGTVVDAMGIPLANAQVALSGRDGARLPTLAFPAPSIRTDSAGFYRLTGLAAGSFELSARPEVESEGLAHITLAAKAGETLRWDARLARRVLIEGRLLDEAGNPAVGLFVVAEAGNERVGEVTETNGLFALAVESDGPYRVTVSENGGPFAEELLVAEEVAPGGMLNLRLPAVAAELATVRGQFEDAGSRVAAQARLVAQLRSTMRLESQAEIVDGGFRLTDVTPGAYTLVIVAGTTPVLTHGPIEVAPREELDVGLLTTAVAGSLVVDVTVAEDVERQLDSIQVVAAETETLGFHALVLEGTGFRAQELAPGSYVLMTMESDVVLRTARFEIEPGIETRVHAELVVAVYREFDVRLSEVPEATTLRITVRDPRQEVVFDVTAPIAEPGTSIPVGHAFSMGRSTITFETNTGQRAECEVEISDAFREATEPIVVELR